MGSITNETPRELKLSCDFLEKGFNYKAHIYKDGPGVDFLTNQYPVTIETKVVTSKDVMDIKLAAGGGMAVYFEKE